MPRENIISGGLEGDGIEGKKRKIKDKSLLNELKTSGGSGDLKDYERGDSFDTDSDSSDPDKKADSGLKKERNKDIFETDFGSLRSTKKYRESSSIGTDSDIFSNGFGSKDAGWMSGRGKKAAEKLPDSETSFKSSSPASKKETSDIFETNIATHPLETGETQEAASLPVKSKDQKKESNDPFYTGFGYTDQRKPKSSPPRSAVNPGHEKAVSVKKTEEHKKSSYLDEDDDDLFS